MHDIVSHNLIEGKEIDTIVSMVEANNFEDFQDNIPIEAGVSPRFLKSARKGKKQGNGDTNQPIRVRPMRSKSIYKR